MIHDAVLQMSAKDFFTLGNGASGFLAVYYALSSNQDAAIAFVLMSAVFDYLDGKLARAHGSENEFGKQLDSLADVVSFGVAPAAIVLSSNYSPMSLIFSVCYVCAGLLRLASFNIQKEKKVYFGLPIPIAALIVVGTYYFFKELAPYVLLLCAVLMVLKFKINKPKF